MQAEMCGSLRTSMESSGSNHAASPHQDMHDLSLMPQSQHADLTDHHGNSMVACLQTMSQQRGVLCTAETQATQQLKVSQHAVQELSSSMLHAIYQLI